MIHGQMVDRTYAPVQEEVPEDDKKGPPIPTAWMQAKVLEYQKHPDRLLEECPNLIVNASCNAHQSMHRANTCFMCKKLPGPKRRAHKHDETCECRMRLPDLARFFSEICTLLETDDWYEFRGQPKEQRIIEICLKRRRFDCFQNTSCKAITESKMSCNSNLSMCMDGPIVTYVVKCILKGTQKDDKAECYSVEVSIKKTGDTRKYPEPEDDRKEAQRRITRGAFANNADTVVGASMAAICTRWGTRFYMSHKTVPCPVKDLIKLGLQGPVQSTATHHLGGEKTYFENQASHCLCRHEELEYLSPFNFYSRYEVCHVKLPKVGKRNHDGTMRKPSDDCLKEGKHRFQVNTGFFNHPSVLKVKELGILCTWRAEA